MENNKFQPIVSPIICSATFSQKTPGQSGYGRVDNPSRLHLEKKLAILEKAKFALAFSSGSAAITDILCLLRSGDHVLCHWEVYEGTLRLLQQVFIKFNISFELVDFKNLEKLKKATRKETKMLWFENMTNPTLQLIDTKNIIVVVDNTFCTPVFANPLESGATIVAHSLTKFINGHHDVLAGAIMLNNKQLFKKLNFLQHTIGAVPSAFDCFLVERGIETLEIRMEKITASSKLIAEFLSKHPKIDKVSFPGFSGLISFWIKGTKNTLKVINNFKKIKIAHSLGGTVTTVMHPQSMMSFSLAKEVLAHMGINGNLIRMSVGLESVEEIVKDIKQALI